MEENKRELSVGERRVRIDFNTTGSTKVDLLKRATAHLIDGLEDLRQDVETSPNKYHDKLRLIALAQTAYEEGAMWAVKALTI